MSNIFGLRDTADYLYKQNRPYEASIIYNEIFRQIWNSIGCIHEGLNDFTKAYLPKKVMTSIEFRKHYTFNVSTTIFYQWFQLDAEEVINVFISILSGHLKCVSYSKTVMKNISKEDVLNEFVVLYTLINYHSDDSWVEQILKYIPPKYDYAQVDKARPNLMRVHSEKRLVKMSAQLVSTEWNHLNFMLIDYLINKGDSNTSFYRGVIKSLGKRPSNYSKSYKTHEQYERKEKKDNYEKYERYEKYEHYEKFETNSNLKNKEFNAKYATESQKARHYGDILELNGLVKRSEIRKQYLKIVGQYHPDKLESLGKDLRTLAEERTKELNEAYEWMKNKYKI